ncbi:MAG: TIGR04255 family protein, partial [Anaerolineae bacterium]
MDPYREIKYGNPPIVEVVAEFRFVPAEPWDLTVPGLVYDRLRGQFPRKRLLKVLEGEAAVEATGIRQEFRLADRMQFLREDEKAYVQVGPDLL